MVSCIYLDTTNIFNRPIHGGSHQLVHALWIMTFNKVGCPTAASNKLLQLLVLNAGKNSRVAYFVAVKMQNR